MIECAVEHIQFILPKITEETSIDDVCSDVEVVISRFKTITDFDDLIGVMVKVDVVNDTNDLSPFYGVPTRFNKLNKSLTLSVKCCEGDKFYFYLENLVYKIQNLWYYYTLFFIKTFYFWKTIYK